MLSARPILEVLLPMPVAELSSALKRTHIFPSFTVAAGLKVSLSIHPTESLCIGQRNLVRVSGLMMGFTPSGRTNPPNVHSGNLFSLAVLSARELPANPQSEIVIAAIKRKMRLNDFMITVVISSAKVKITKYIEVLKPSKKVLRAL